MMMMMMSSSSFSSSSSLSSLSSLSSSTSKNEVWSEMNNGPYMAVHQTGEVKKRKTQQKKNLPRKTQTDARAREQARARARTHNTRAKSTRLEIMGVKLLSPQSRKTTGRGFAHKINSKRFVRYARFEGYVAAVVFMSVEEDVSTVDTEQHLER